MSGPRQETPAPDPARAVLDRQRADVAARIARHTGEILRALSGGRHWFTPEVSRARVQLQQALANRAVANELLAALDELDSLGVSS